MCVCKRRERGAQACVGHSGARIRERPRRVGEPFVELVDLHLVDQRGEFLHLNAHSPLTPQPSLAPKTGGCVPQATAASTPAPAEYTCALMTGAGQASRRGCRQLSGAEPSDALSEQQRQRRSGAEPRRCADRGPRRHRRRALARTRARACTCPCRSALLKGVRRQRRERRHRTGPLLSPRYRARGGWP